VIFRGTPISKDKNTIRLNHKQSENKDAEALLRTPFHTYSISPLSAEEDVLG
jgi:hypothetical protein